jgi:hypothetical protein
MQVAEMLRAHPQATNAELADLISDLTACAQTCTSCADACLGEEGHLNDLVRCIRLNLDCADVCEATARVLTRQTAFEPGVARALLEACAEACRVCAEECERHAQMGMEHCRICAEVCRRCEQACRDGMSTLAA